MTCIKVATILCYTKGKINTELSEQENTAANQIPGIASLGWNLPSAPFAGSRKQNKSK
jgi:hypothetical protein